MQTHLKHKTSPNKYKFNKSKYIETKDNEAPVIPTKSDTSLHLSKIQISLFKPVKKASLFIQTINTEPQFRKQFLPKISFSLNRMNQGEKINTSNIYSSLSITTKSWCLYDSKADQYYGFRQEYQRQIASLTKIMTACLSIEVIQRFHISLQCMVRITRTASSLGGTTANLDFDKWISLQDLLYGIMLPSGNDAAYCISEYIGFFLTQFYRDAKKGRQFYCINQVDLSQSQTSNYVQQFISSMNQKSLELNLYRTRFSNPHGLQNALNISSAKDIIVLSNYAAKNQLFATIMKTISHRYKIYQKPNSKIYYSKKWSNSNKLLQKGWEGVKTGHTSSAGSCLCSLKEGIFICVLNSQNISTRFTDTEKIFEWYKDRLSPSIKRQMQLYLDSKIFVKQRILSESCF